jgi:hypothetical protein
MSDPLLNLLAKGLFYFHGRTKNYSPVIVIDFSKILILLKSKEMDNFSYCALHNFMVMYMEKNMLVPGLIEKWTVISNLG